MALHAINTKDGQFVLTLGPDYVKRALVSNPQEAEDFALEGSEPTTFANYENTLVVGCKDGTVKSYNVEKLEYEREIFTGISPVLSLDFDGEGKRLAIATHDKTALVALSEISQITTIPLKARSITWCPTDNDVVAISGQDSNVYIQNLRNGNAKSTKDPVISGVLPGVTLGDDRFAHAIWSPAGDVLAMPTKSLDVVVYDRDECLERSRFCQNDQVIEAKWCPNGRYLACLTAHKGVYIWHVGAGTPATIEQVPSEICSIDWHPHDNELTLLSSEDGSFRKLVPVPQALASPVGSLVTYQAEVNEYKRGNRQGNDKLETLIASDDDDLGLGGDTENEDEDSIPAQAQRGENEEVELEADDPFEDYRAAKRIRFENGDVRAFQSGSTPWFNRKRILCTNYVGYVWSTYQDNDHNTITVSFFDQGDHRDYHFEDENKFDIAAIGNKASVLAKAATGKILVRLHDSRIDSWEHECQQPLRSVAVSDKIVVLCTEFGVVYTYSIYGNPISVSRESRDPVLTCAANDGILVTVRSGFSGPCYTIEDVLSQRYYQKNDSLDIGPHVTLKSLFFNDNGDPCIADSDHIISTLVHWREAGQARWVPVFSSNEFSKQEDRSLRCWPIGIFDRQLLCVKLKDKKLHPTIPFPVTALVDLKIPGIENEHEAGYLLQSTLHNQYSARMATLEGDGNKQQVLEEVTELAGQAEQDISMNLLKQFQSACAANLPNRCLSIASLIQTEQALEVAAQIASRYNLHSVVERIQS